MFVSSRSISPFACAVLAFTTVPAAATTYSFDLAGDVAAGVTDVFTVGANEYTIFRLELTGFTGPLALEVGDVLDIHVTLDEPVNVPAAGLYTFAGVDVLTSPDQLANVLVDGTSDTTLSPLDGDYAGQTFSGNCGNCLNASIFLEPGPAFQIGTFDATVTILNLSAIDPDYTGPINLTGFQFAYQLTSAVTAARTERFEGSTSALRGRLRPKAG